MKKLLTNLFQTKPTNIIGLDIGSDTIKLAEVYIAGKEPVLVAAAITALQPGSIKDGRFTDEKAIASQLRQLVASSGLSARHAVIGIGGQSSFLREIVFPGLQENELKEAVQWEIGKYVPYEPGSFYHDYAVIEAVPAIPEIKVMVAAAPKDIIDSLVNIVKTLKIKSIAIEIESMAVGRTLEQTDRVMVLDIGGSVSQAAVFLQGHLVVTRTIPLGGQRVTKAIMSHMAIDFDEAERQKKSSDHLLRLPEEKETASLLHLELEGIVKELAREVRRTIEYVQLQKGDVAIEKVFVTGGGALLRHFTDHLSFHLGLPVFLHKPINVGVADSFDSSFNVKMLPQLATAIGLALRERKVNLL